jgi:hypothetical protein
MTRAAVVSAVIAPGDRAHALSWFTSQPSSSMGRPANGQSRPAFHATPDHTAPFSDVLRRAASWPPSRVGGAQFARRHAKLAAEGAVKGGQVGKPPAERDIGHRTGDAHWAAKRSAAL